MNFVIGSPMTDSSTAQAGTKEWLEVSKNMVIVACSMAAVVVPTAVVRDYGQLERFASAPFASTPSRDRYRDPDSLV